MGIQYDSESFLDAMSYFSIQSTIIIKLLHFKAQTSIVQYVQYASTIVNTPTEGTRMDRAVSRSSLQASELVPGHGPLYTHSVGTVGTSK